MLQNLSLRKIIYLINIYFMDTLLSYSSSIKNNIIHVIWRSYCILMYLK